MEEEKTTKEEFKVSGQDVLKQLKRLVKEGSVRRIIIKNEKGNSILNFLLP